jgi:hypothetical protein
MPDKFDHPELAKLSSNARLKVETALKATLDKELAAGIVNSSDTVAAHSRSQGAFFSRSKTTDQMLGDDRVMIDKISTLDEAAFEQFASRLSKIKGLKTR